MLRTLLPFIVVLPSLAYALISLACAVKYFKGQGSRVKGQVNDFDSNLPLAPCPLPLGVSILKPVKGMDGDSYDNFASFCCQEYPGDVQLVFAVASPDDPVVAVIRQLMADFSNHDIRLVINPAALEKLLAGSPAK